MGHKSKAMRIAESEHRQAMASTGESHSNPGVTVEKLVAEIGEAMALLKSGHRIQDEFETSSGLQPALLQQCLEMCAPGELPAQEPIRTIHHFACTGGTLISKCVAALPNTQVLSEVDPLSPLGRTVGTPRFTPTDMISLVRQATRDVDESLIVELFRTQLKCLHENALSLGQYLVIRDHAHSHFCTGTHVPDRQTLLELIEHAFPVRSVVTVRDPIDSYASLVEQKWLHFSPKTFDEYCRRYLAFLDRYAALPMIRYEDFVASPEHVMKHISDLLGLPFSPDFIDLFMAFRMTGDSGRVAAAIGHRMRRPLAAELADQPAQSPSYRALALRLGYLQEPGASKTDSGRDEESESSRR
jgi:hypothetical protein